MFDPISFKVFVKLEAFYYLYKNDEVKGRVEVTSVIEDDFKYAHDQATHIRPKVYTSHIVQSNTSVLIDYLSFLDSARIESHQYVKSKQNHHYWVEVVKEGLSEQLIREAEGHDSEGKIRYQVTKDQKLPDYGKRRDGEQEGKRPIDHTDNFNYNDSYEQI